jgi:dipeptidyl-peptidase-4
MEEYPIGKKELFTITTEDGRILPACWTLPPDFSENKTYPVLFTIYGGPGSSDVSNSFPRLSQLYLAQEGIIVFAVDHRGSGHFGKNGMAFMHRNLGKWEMHDLIQAVKWLHKKSFVDKSKIGITGGSYGGYTTCMALTYGADYFTHGYARSSVTDWRLYDSVYTERYMDSPIDNQVGYEFGAAMTHAHKLKGTLFMSHGNLDDNVHMQNTIQLMDALMDLGKSTFEFMVYPDQKHGTRGKKREHSNRHYIDFWFKHFLDR